MPTEGRNIELVANRLYITIYNLFRNFIYQNKIKCDENYATRQFPERKKMPFHTNVSLCKFSPIQTLSYTNFPLYKLSPIQISPIQTFP